jgi:hypothetical protein
MKNSIYTSYGFGVLNNKENIDWVNLQKNKMIEYCKKHGLAFNIIDEKNKFMQIILNNFQTDKKPSCKDYNVYTLSAIAAILDFCDSGYDNFYWLHLDMAINLDNINIFDILNIDNNHVYCWSNKKPTQEDKIGWANTKIEWLKYLISKINLSQDEEFYTLSNASLIFANKQSAMSFKQILLEHLDILNIKIETKCIEETILELVYYICKKKNLNLNIKEFWGARKQGPYAPAQFYEESFDNLSIDETVDKYKNAIFIHFWGESKKHIPEFYRRKNENNNNTVW